MSKMAIFAGLSAAVFGFSSAALAGTLGVSNLEDISDATTGSGMFYYDVFGLSGEFLTIDGFPDGEADGFDLLSPGSGEFTLFYDALGLDSDGFSVVDVGFTDTALEFLLSAQSGNLNAEYALGALLTVNGFDLVGATDLMDAVAIDLGTAGEIRSYTLQSIQTTPVPLPAGIVLLGSGVLAIGAMRRVRAAG